MQRILLIAGEDGLEKRFLVQVALEGTLSNGDAAPTGSTRSVKRYYVKYNAKSSDRDRFADTIVSKVMQNVRFFESGSGAIDGK